MLCLLFGWRLQLLFFFTSVVSQAYEFEGLRGVKCVLSLMEMNEMQWKLFPNAALKNILFFCWNFKKT